MKSLLYIKTGADIRGSYLRSSYCSQPFKLMDISEDKLNKTLMLMLMTSSPGILDKDEYCMQIEVENNTSLELKTQSFQRLYSMKNGASQILNINICENATFSFIAHPVVPYSGSSFYAYNKISLEKNATLKWGEILTCGRKMNGEIFKFSSYQNVTEIQLKGKLILRENLLIQPEVNSTRSLGMFEGFTHQAMFIFFNELCSIKEKTNEIADWLIGQEDIISGITKTSVNGFVIKILGNSAEQLFNILNTINSNFLSDEHDH